jgi:hypothetical protein
MEIKAMAKTEKSYVYFGKRHFGDETFTELLNHYLTHGWCEYDAKHWTSIQKVIKIGETNNIISRKKGLSTHEHTMLTRFVCFDGTKDDRLFIESYLRTRYAANPNMAHFGNDHFTCRTANTIKGAENNFFVYVAEAFALLEQIKHKHYSYECVTL